MPALDPKVCYRALTTRDARFDGRLFVGVTSTGIYCRPVCPERTPKAENCRFFSSAAGAQEAGECHQRNGPASAVSPAPRS